MKNDIKNIFGDSMTNSLENLVDCFDKANLTPEEIADYIADSPDLTRTGMHIIALSEGNKKLADKIAKANELIKLKQIDEFKKSVANDTYEEFLAKISWTDKSLLLVNMGLSKSELSSKKKLTEEEQRYFEIIDNSINKDLEKEAISEGFDSVEAWRNHNAMQSIKEKNKTNIIRFNRWL